MKPNHALPRRGFGLLVAVCLALLLTVSPRPLQAADDALLKKLMEENAALRQENADLRKRFDALTPPPSPAPAAQPGTPAAPAAATTAPAAPVATNSPASSEDVVMLSPFSVTSDKDHGYLKTNAATATRIGMEIQKVPMNISVVSREFIDDTNAKSLMDILRYTSSSSGDTRWAMRRPGNEATPQGAFTMRGFPVNTLMENGVFRYISYNIDNVDRVEIVKGPAAVFFGQGYPGGVINYVTKQPSFAKIPDTFRHSINDNSGQKLVLDFNKPLSKYAAFRMTGAWDDQQGERRFEFRKNYNLTPSVTLIPFDSKVLTVNLAMEYVNESFNQNDYDWIWSDFAGWKAAAAGSAKVANSVNTPSLAYATYINNKRIATGNYSLPAYTSVERGAYYTNASGNFIHDKAFNYTSRGARTNNEVAAFTATVDFSPVSWLDGRYVFQHDNSRFNNIEGVTTPYADGIHWNVGASATSGYYRNTDTHQLDLIFKFETGGIKHKLLTGYNRTVWLQNYFGNDIKFTPYYGHVPGATNPIANPGYGTTGGTQVADNLVGEGRGHDTGVPVVNQVVRDRNGQIKLVKAVYSDFDPGYETYPTIDILFPLNRAWLDGYKPILDAGYLNYQAAALDDRLNVIAGFRRQWREEKGQYLASNYPWYVVPVDAWKYPSQYPEDVYGYSANYVKTNIYRRHGDAWMGGASFAVTKALTVYTSVSKTFQFNLGNVGGVFTGNERPVIQSALDQNGGHFMYQGTNITSVDQLVAIQAAKGAYDDLKDETGMNYEFGAKISTADSKIVGTLSFFRGERTNQKLDDTARQSNLEEPLNSNTTLFAPGTVGYNTRVFRWRTTNLKNRIEGSEAEVIWTPMPNLQTVINGSWLWTAKTLYDKTRPAPGSTAYNALSTAGKVASDIYYNARIENVPEYKFTAFGKYTFLDGALQKLSIGGGARYSSKTVVSRSVDWNPLAGGYQAGNYVVFDATVGYPWRLFRYDITSSFGIYNLTDKQYSEGSFVLSPGRNWLLTNTVSF
ncbi:MAG: TonB-dependent receptor plug domain-containing protein [Verrucomicrobia bacterium]|nr:TonB-dependent receptor plug domain-containing protein [Verrucomicrobiota bacterium]